jgi:hypothetical protein
VWPTCRRPRAERGGVGHGRAENECRSEQAGSSPRARPRKKRFVVFSEKLFSVKTNLEQSGKCLGKKKYSEKSQKFQENSQRLIGS